MAEVYRNRFEDDRLWDDQGVEWSRARPRWIPEQRIRQLIRRDQRVAVLESGGGEGVSWLTAAEAKVFWHTIKGHIEGPPDDHGLVYSGTLWRCEDRLLLAIQESC
ncbi:hypothetical protein AB0M43_10570 [Longispora sp. NPDC051575]|uniref:hypothetical protein n=1 Tax=Longispora sp. NPDC051575 TaxID=3154943 RepID=UPI0034430FBE